MKKRLSLVLVIAMLALLLTACSGLKTEDLVGVWQMDAQDTVEQAEALLEHIDAYDEEVALADLNGLMYVKVVEFCEDKTYSYRVDAAGTKAFVRAFYEDYFTALYDGRSSLNEVYGETFDDMTEEDFLQYYATLYGVESYEELLDTVTENAYDYDLLQEPTEEGTFSISGEIINCTINGESESAGMKARFSGENNECLTLIYADGEEVYTRVG